MSVVKHNSSRYGLPRPSIKLCWSLIVLLILCEFCLHPVPVSAQEDAPVPNPLGNFLKDLFGKNKQQEDESESPQQESSQAKPHDPRIPYEREFDTILADARRRVVSRQWPEAINIYQKLIDDANDSMMQDSAGNYRSLGWHVQELIGSLPPEALRLYQRTQGPIAQRLLAEADQKLDIQQFRNVATRYFHTDAGQQAANRVASYHLDRGDFAIAALWYVRLCQGHPKLTENPVWKLHVEAVLNRAGFQDAEMSWLSPLSEDQLQQLARRYPDQSLEEIRQAWESIIDYFQQTQREWYYPGGTPNRSGQLQGERPLLKNVWSQQTTSHPLILQQLDQIQKDMQVGRYPTIPALQPISVSGKIAFRTFDGLCVIEAETGERLWETHDVYSMTQLLTNDAAPVLTQLQNSQRSAVSPIYRPDQIESHALPNLLFRDSVHNSLTSDGNLLYAIEENVILTGNQHRHYYSNQSPADRDPLSRDWNTNRLVAYDLQSGRQQWSVGGSSLAVNLDEPLADVFFFGPPLPDDGQLFLTGEHHNAIELYCLDASSGALLWSCPLGFPDVSIDKDYPRRWWPGQIALSAGVLICPTNMGLVAAVDRNAQEVIWMKTYTETASQDTQQQRFGNRNYTLTDPGTLKNRWASTPPMIIHQTAILAPSDHQSLLGFRLADGKLLWKIDNLDDGLYPVGRIDDHLLVVHQSGLTAYDVAEGHKLWSRSFAHYHDQQQTQVPLPCGRAVLTEDLLYLPMSHRELWYFDLQQREFVGRTRLADSRKTLGNLIMANGEMVSASVSEVTLFKPRAEVSESITTRLQHDPEDFNARTEQAMVHFLEQDFEQAYESMHQIAVDQLTQGQLARYREQLRQILFGLAGHSSAKTETYLLELRELVETPHDQARYLQLLSETQLALQDYEAALETYQQIYRLGYTNLIADGHDENLQVRMDVWLRARLSQLWSISSGQTSSRITRSVQEATQHAIDQGRVADLLAAIRIYGFHSDAVDLYLELYELGLSEHDFAISQYAMKCLFDHEDPVIVHTAMANLAQLLRSHELHQDADAYVSLLSEQDPETTLLDGTTLGEWLQHQQVIAEQSSDQLTQNGKKTWAHREYEIEQIGISHWNHNSATVNLEHSNLPYFQNHRFSFNQKQSRLEIIENHTDSLRASIPLSVRQNEETSHHLPIRCYGHQIMMFHKGVIQSYSIPDQELLWERAVSRDNGTAGITVSQRQFLSQLHKASYATSRFRLNQNQYEFGPLALMTNQVLYYLGRNELIAVDPTDGKIRWVRSGLPNGCMVYGDHEQICLIPPDLNQVMLLDADDGRNLPVSELPLRFKNGISVAGNNIVCVTKNNASGAEPPPTTLLEDDFNISSPITLEARNILTGEIVWSHGMQEKDYIGLLNDNRAIHVDADNRLLIIDTLTGELIGSPIEVPSLDASELREFFAFVEQGRLFLIANHKVNHSTYLNITNQRINGKLFCLDLNSGEQVWEQDVEKLNLVLSDLHQPPVLILAANSYERKHNLYVGLLKLKILDKATGQTLVAGSLLQNQIRQITWEGARHIIRLHSYNTIYTVRPKEAVTKREEN